MHLAHVILTHDVEYIAVFSNVGVCCDEMPYYIVMEFMNNGSLHSVLQEGPVLSVKVHLRYKHGTTRSPPCEMAWIQICVYGFLRESLNLTIN